MGTDDGAVPAPRTERPRQRARTRTSLKQAARKLFTDGGYLTCSVGDIVAEAGVSRAVFYLHFRDKRDLLAAVVQDSLTAQRYFLARSALRAEPTDDDLRRWIERYIANLTGAMENVRLLNLGSFVDPALGAKPYEEQDRGVLRIAQLSPGLRILDADGSVRHHRLARFNILVFAIGQVALSIGYEMWHADRAMTMDILVAEFRRFVDEG